MLSKKIESSAHNFPPVPNLRRGSDTSISDVGLEVRKPLLLPLSQRELWHMADFMRAGSALLLGHVESDQIQFGEASTGTITMQSDLTLSKLYLDRAAAIGRFGFSEETDPRNEQGELLRKLIPSGWEFDPVDGSGDRKKGLPGTPSGDGYTTLANFFENGIPTAGICVRPAHREIWIMSREGIELQRISNDYRSCTPISFVRAPRPDEKTIRVNTRPAYPETNLPQGVLDIASELSGGLYRFLFVEAGGAGDCFCRLMKGDLDIVVSGRKTDWKTWDTNPFGIALNLLQGSLTDYQNNPLTRKVSDSDLWHTEGVLASIGVSEAHAFLVKALTLYRERSRHADGMPLIYDPRKKIVTTIFL